MSVTAKPLINSKYAAASTTTEYTVPALNRTIIDKFTVTNQDGSSRTVSIYLIPSAETAGDSNLIVNALSISAGSVVNIPELQNQILTSGDKIACLASVASMVVIRASGREVT